MVLTGKDWTLTEVKGCSLSKFLKSFQGCDAIWCKFKFLFITEAFLHLLETFIVSSCTFETFFHDGFGLVFFPKLRSCFRLFDWVNWQLLKIINLLMNALSFEINSRDSTLNFKVKIALCFTISQLSKTCATVPPLKSSRPLHGTSANNRVSCQKIPGVSEGV